MILHLVCDEKFIDYAIDLFQQVAPAQNEFLAVIPCQDYKFKYIKQVDKIGTVLESEAGMNELLKRIDQYDAIIFHSLFPGFFHQVIDRMDKTPKMVWLFWGGEFYEHPDVCKDYQGSLTMSAYHKSIRMRKALVRILSVFRSKKQMMPDVIKSVRKMSHIVTAFPEDYDTVTRVWQANAQWLWWNYYSIEETLGTLMDKETNGNNILLGNSATLPNNHLEVLSILHKMDLTGRKVFIPLSYGNPTYAKFLIRESRKRIGEHSAPLVDFMPRDEYNQMMLGCGIVIMNHYRQQAVGNVVTALWLGAKVFMSERSTVYRHFADAGAVIYTVEKDLSPDDPAIFTPLTIQEKEKNKQVIYAEYSKENMLQKTQLLVDRLLNG